MSEHKYLTDEQLEGLYLSCPPVAKPMHSDIIALRAELKAAQAQVRAFEQRDVRIKEELESVGVPRVDNSVMMAHNAGKEIVRLRESHDAATRAVFDAANKLIAQKAELDRMRTALESAKQVIAAARCIRHWSDTREGMIVSAEHVRALWNSLAEYDRALDPQPAQQLCDVCGHETHSGSCREDLCLCTQYPELRRLNPQPAQPEQA